MQVQTDKCYSETENDAFMCDSIVHVYRYTVILSYTVTFHRLELFYILHRRLGFYTMFKSPVSVFLQLCVFLQINPRVCCYQIELVRSGWIVTKIPFFTSGLIISLDIESIERNFKTSLREPLSKLEY